MGGGRPTPQGFDPLPTQRVPLWTILSNPFLVTNSNIFLKAPMAPIYTNFKGGRVAEKTHILQKVLKNAFFGPFFQKFACGAEILAKTESLKCFGRAWKINLVDLKRRSRKFSKILDPRENPRENPRSASAK